MKYAFGVDIGGERIRLSYLDETGRLLEKWTVETPRGQGTNQMLSVIAEQIEAYMSENGIFEDNVAGIGVGIPGPVNSSGTVNKCVNLGWGMFNIDRALSGLTGLNVVATNIANAAALGECWMGSGRHCANLFYVSVNTGVGGAIIANGHLISGAHGGGGEIGHMIVNRQETESCTCGNKGCLEQYCSPSGIVRVAKRHLAAGASLSPLRLKRNLTHEDVFAAAAKGDKAAKEILEKVYTYAGEMIANVCAVTNPDTVILGGQLTRFGRPVLEGIARQFQKYVFHANREVRFELATLGEDGALYGAARLALDGSK